MTASDGASSISVTVRVRPFTIREAAQLTRTEDGPLFLGDGSLAGAPTPRLAQKGLRQIIKVVDDRCLVFDPPEDNPVQRFTKSVVPLGKRVKDQTFAFDKVFDENTTQADVYESTTKNLLDSVLDGYNATVFAYGATGCGKTHTITGTVQAPGIIFLTMQELFERIAEKHEDKVTEVSLSYLEIYNETIRDLLVPGGTKAGLMLREDEHQAISVAGLSSHHPHNVQEVMDIIVRGNENRTMSPTEANATSSRSHAVLQINVSMKDRNADINEPHTMATLSIIDLAGSERASATKNRGDRLAEGANINKSLLSLGSCINALCDPRKRNHVPYRNSKLTRLLKFSLGGNCKTVMIVCVSPSSAHFDETQNTLRYANRAKNIQTKVTRNVFNVNRHVKDFLMKIDEQMVLINELKAQQKEYESVAFGKFKKQGEKKDGIVKEGVIRLRNAYEHCNADRQERIGSAKKLRQIEKRIAVLTSWLTAFDYTCEAREDEEPPKTIVAMRKTAQGILIELEQSRSHYHHRLAKSNWQRAIDTALQNGLKQVEDSETYPDLRDQESLQKEAELLKLKAEREMHLALLDHEKQGDSASAQMLLKTHFETVAIVNQLLHMPEHEAVQAAKKNLHQVLNACTETVQGIIKPDPSMQALEAFPPTKAGTPKRKKAEILTTSSPIKAMTLAPPVMDTTRFQISPAKASPRRRAKLGTPRKGVSFTPQKKRSPSKRAVRWRDDTEDGALAEWSKTPQKQDEETPTTSSLDTTEVPLPPQPRLDYLTENASDTNSSPIPAPPQTAIEIKPAAKSGRFATGFLSRKNGSPASNALNSFSSSPEPSPLQEVTVNKASGRLSSDLMPPPSKDRLGLTNSYSSSDVSSSSSADDAREVHKALKRVSLSHSHSRHSSGHHSVHGQNRIHRRRSPPTGSNASSPTATNENAAPNSNSNTLFTASHARRMVKSDRDLGSRHSVLSPRATPVMKGRESSAGSGARRATLSMSVERELGAGAGGRHSAGARGGGGVRMSGSGGAGVGAVPGSASRGSLSSARKGLWR